MNNLIQASIYIPINAAVPTISINSVTLNVDNRGLPLELRITAPMSGNRLPILLLSHGHGPSLYLSSKDGYGPLVNFYSAHGFVVIQPTHANSRVAGLDSTATGGPLFWRSRVLDMKAILDQLGAIEAATPLLAGRIDHSKIVAVGHSMGAQTIGMLLGARLTDPNDKEATDVNMIEPRIVAGVLLAPPGNGGQDLSEFARTNYSALNPDYAHMSTRSLVVAGDNDVNPHLTTRGADWPTDPFHFSPGSDALLTVFGGKHGLGGVAGYDAKETDDEDPDRLAAVQRLSWAYLRSALYTEDPAWPRACEALAQHASLIARIDTK
jgi:predicted dienelactone hydrolase